MLYKLNPSQVPRVFSKMNRIYQGRVTRVELPNARRHRELFKER